MVELVYMSHAQYIFNETELVELLELARRNNTRRGITGMLLFDGVGTFIQAIEGEKEQIDELYAIIKQDDRHAGIQQLSYSEVFSRNFSDWKMAYKLISDDSMHKLEGYSTFMSEGQNVGGNTSSSIGLQMLNHFRQTTG